MRLFDETSFQNEIADTAFNHLVHGGTGGLQNHAHSKRTHTAATEKTGD
jgi:hypothetical protein